MASVKHLNSGKCEKCLLIFKAYPNFYQPLQDWFFQLQSKHPDCHIAYAGRGKAEQEDFFAKGTSKAHWGESPHNYGLAIDIFQLTITGARWDVSWYKAVVNSEVKKTDWLMHGMDFVKFKDSPHVEVKTWKDLVKAGTAKLVE